ncbi:bifunctional oligoribonuclease/PAP phosphatase NrnA [Corynebacterium felinum]|uniref:Phosphoesterase RecJ-like protein n=1 Tax=Corynebacterium felinum TaxID=131318 RepID=A0ABU2BBF2_9CORY|nr:bifunctional oligoribonuclease/PAP phosphatase NrnA [Corynebacterium felinum]MDF5819911.1 bifunctional oligoribonuclease/PAP phosphatase NrnA [Corynebacterium felinum]MDR7355945.1 phosphoesterase RecJ-like protein [Corynebacterium felinum]
MSFPSALGALDARGHQRVSGEPDWEEATRRTLASRRFCVVGHRHPDADAIGSVCALLHILDQLGKDAVGIIGQSEPIDPALLTIPGADRIQLADSLPECDVIFVVDCGSSSRMGLVEDAVMAREQDVILIDHHASNSGCRGINLIDYEAESTTTVIWQWLDHLGVSIDQPMAHALYVGLLTDTHGFRWGRPSMHSMAKELVDTGLDIRTIGNQMFSGFSIADLKVMGTVLSQLSIVRSQCHDIAVAVVDYSMVSQASPSAVEALADYIKGVQDTDFAVVIKEYEPGLHGISLRSDTVDVSQLARNLGGGGHLRSAGFKVVAPVDEIIAAIIEQASRSCVVLRKNQETPLVVH